MRKLVCADCGKRYDFDVDDFCPRCGSFNQPRNKWGIDSAGNVVRVDGVNEANHTGSFVHGEFHREKASRREKGLDRDHLPPAKKFTASPAKKARPKSVTVAPSLGGAREKQGKKGGAASVVGIVLVLLALLLEILLD